MIMDKIERIYWDNGQLRYEFPYQQEQQHGISRYWYANRQLCYEHLYYQGQLHGIAKGWYNDGKLMYKLYYLYGDQVTPEEYRHHELVEKLSGL